MKLRMNTQDPFGITINMGGLICDFNELKIDFSRHHREVALVIENRQWLLKYLERHPSVIISGLSVGIVRFL